MIKQDAEPGRELLGFVEAVESSFAFLVSDHGFTLTQVEPTYMRYKTEDVFLVVYHGRSSCEIDVEIGQIVKNPDQIEVSYSMGEIIEFAGASKETGYTYFMATTPENVLMHVRTLAEYTKKYALNVLAGDQQTWDDLEKTRRKISNLITREYKLKAVRRDVDSAWREKNFPRVVELYGSVEEDLAASEKKKLEYARKRLAN
jgi:hypothetical protein